MREADSPKQKEVRNPGKRKGFVIGHVRSFCGTEKKLGTMDSWIWGRGDVIVIARGERGGKGVKQ